MVEWRRWWQSAEDALAEAALQELRLWLQEQSLSEGMREAIERTRRAYQRWEERTIAFEAYRDWQERR